VPEPAASRKTDPRVDRTRKLISEAFLEVMDKVGFEGLTVNDIAEKAGINRATFYAHFADKHELLSHEVRIGFTELIQGRGLWERSLDKEAVSELFQAACDYVAALHDHCKPPLTHLDWVMKDEVTGLASELFLAWAAASGPKARKLPVLAATAASSALYGLVVHWDQGRKEESAKVFVKKALPFVAASLGLA
jgi:AcrR family transcriptional regulator